MKSSIIFVANWRLHHDIAQYEKHSYCDAYNPIHDFNSVAKDIFFYQVYMNMSTK